MISLNKDIDFVESELLSIRSGSHRSGIRIGRLLVLVENTEYWRKEGSSGFTAWMSQHAKDFGVRDTMIWNHYRGALIYEKIRPKMVAWGVSTPMLEELGDNVSTENLDFLHRIMLAAPESVVRPLAERVINGTVRRAELREVWHTYRGVVKSDPLRKGRIITKGFEGKNTGKLFEAAALNALNQDQRWAADETALDVFKILPEPNILFPRNPCPAALLLRKVTGGKLEIHGLEVKVAINERLDARIASLAPYVDRLWIIIPPGCGHSRVPFFVGIIEVDGAGVHVVRPAADASVLGGRVLELARHLLVGAYK